MDKNVMWKDVIGYEGLYKISNAGHVLSFKIYKCGALLNPVMRKGYLYVNLCKDKEIKMRAIHQLVATAFVLNPNRYQIINHIDCDKLNNFSYNLEWCTISHNTKHAFDNGKMDYVKNRLRNEKGQYK